MTYVLTAKGRALLANLSAEALRLLAEARARR